MKKSVTKKAKTIDRIIIAVLLVMAVGIAAFSFPVREGNDLSARILTSVARDIRYSYDGRNHVLISF